MQTKSGESKLFLRQRGLMDGSLWPAEYAWDNPKCLYRFLTECCWTYNEANSEVALIPPLGYVEELSRAVWECRTSGRPLIIEKSRRLIVSWILRGCELWRCGLAAERGVIAGLNYDKAAEHVWRIWWLYKELRSRRPEFELPPCTGREGNTAAQQLGQVLLPNGSLVEMLNQDGQSFQGSGYAWVTMEEFSLYRNCDYMWAQAIRVCQGKPGTVPGSVVAVTNASPNKAWHGIKRLSAEAQRDLGLERADSEANAARFNARPLLRLPCLNGAEYFRLHFSADPGKDKAWAAAERVKVPEREWLREMEMREDIYEGEPVFPDYRDKWHCDLVGIGLCRGSKYLGGWDCGGTLVPAFVLLEVTPLPWQVRAMLEVISPGAEPMEKFAPRVLQALQKRVPGRWDEVEHWGDHTVIQRSGVNGENAQQAAKRYGFNIRPASNELEGRLGAVTWLLNDSVDRGTPRFLVDGRECPTLREAFQGAYRLEIAPGDAVGPGRVLKERPAKNDYSHVADALQYAACRARRVVKGGA